MKLDRRTLLRAGLGAALVPALGRLERHGGAVFSDDRPHRFIQIFLTGGWDSALGTDPVIGTKASFGAYDPYYAAQPIKTVPGKANLVVGGGLIPALPAFQAAPTAFVNGLWIEVAAHDLATQYLLTGIPTLARTDANPAYVARMGAASGRFPSHVVLGQVPLGDTKATAPPLQSMGVGGIRAMLRKPGQDWLDDGTRQTAFELGRTLDELRYGTDLAGRSAVLSAWLTADRRVPELYDKGFGPLLEPSPELFARYGAEGELSIAGQLAGCFLVQKSNISRLVTTTTGDFDTHSNQDPRQINQLRELGTALNALVADLRATADPDAPRLSLMDTTTILIVSEFVRTPTFNKGGGTDHWQSASAIVMGSGVRDNTVVGATGPDAKALGWDGQQAVPRTPSSQVVPEMLAAAIMRQCGFSAEAAEVADKPLPGVFL